METCQSGAADRGNAMTVTEGAPENAGGLEQKVDEGSVFLATENFGISVPTQTQKTCV